MNKTRLILNVVAIAIVILTITSIGQAQASRTWVSGVGNDADPCSRTAPCKTYAGAMSKTATGGEISTLDPGGFGAVSVNKSITIDGTNGAGYGSILASNTTGVLINDSAGTPNTAIVNLRNLSIQGIGPSGSLPGTFGVRMISGKSLTIENCVINGFTVAASGTGVEINMSNGSATEVYIRNTTIQNCRTGIRMTQPSGFVSGTFDGVRIGHMSVDGIQLQTSAFAEIRNTTISFAVGNGLTITGAGQASVVNTMITHCATGINIGAATTSRITHSQILLNGTGVNFAGGTLRSFGDNVYDGNSNNFVGGAISPQGQQ